MSTVNQIRENSPTAADEHWGYRFGVDGVLGTDQAMDFLGGISRATLYRMIAANKIRRGRDPDGKKVVVCRRSCVEYLSQIED